MTARSLRRSLFLWLIGPLAAVLCLGAFIAFDIAWRSTRDTFDLSLLDTALDLSRQLHVVRGAPALDLPAAARQMLATNNEDRVSYAVRSGSGKLISGEPSLPIKTFPSSESRQQYYDAEVGKVPVRAIALRSELGAEPVYIAVAQTLKARDRMFVRILASLLVPEVLVAAASLAVVWFGVRRGLAPAERLRSEIVSRSPADLRAIEESSAPEELRAIVHAINELLARLQLALQSQRQFIADAAHQLRTPLAVLRARIEVALGKSASVDRATLEELLASTERTTRLANQLLSLARAEHVETSGEVLQTVDLKQLVTDVAEDWVARAAAKGLDLAFEVQPLGLRGNAFLIREMLGNLLDNAVAYTPAGGAITVRLRAEDGAPVVEVEDSGPGIPLQYREQVTQRFFRLPDTATPGCGLGLAIVAEIAHAHGAELRFSDPAKGSGLVATVKFAAADRAEPPAAAGPEAKRN